MPNQDTADGCTASQALKELLEVLLPNPQLPLERHGNAIVSPYLTAVTAMLALGWASGQNLSERFRVACQAVQHAYQRSPQFHSRQGMFKALQSLSESLVQAVRGQFVSALAGQKKWLLLGRPTFGVDATKLLLARTRENQAHFAAAPRKGSGRYKNQADCAKASTPQIQLSLCFHLVSGLPYCWKSADSSAGERELLYHMLPRLPKQSRLVMDAMYFGYDFWNALLQHPLTFVVRASGNVELLTCLDRPGCKFRQRRGLVLYWPQNVRAEGKEPILLRLVEVLVGRRKMFLLTNELELADQSLAELYRMRWGIEVFFRTVKQSWERSKLDSRTPANVFSELNWMLLGVWATLWLGQQHSPGKHRMSAIQVLRTLSQLITDVARKARTRWNVRTQLQSCVLQDESNRTTSKSSRNYPRKKKKRKTTTAPNCIPCSTLFIPYLKGHAKKSLPA